MSNTVAWTCLRTTLIEQQGICYKKGQKKDLELVMNTGGCGQGKVLPLGPFPKKRGKWYLAIQILLCAKVYSVVVTFPSTHKEHVHHISL